MSLADWETHGIKVTLLDCEAISQPPLSGWVLLVPRYIKK